METIKTLEKRWRRYPILEIQNYNHDTNTPVKKFIEDIFLKYNSNPNHRSLVKTTKEQMGYTGAKRSFIDIFGLCRNYYKGVTLEEVSRSLFELCKEEKIWGNWFCDTINRYVFSTHPSWTRLNKHKVSLDGDYWIDDMLKDLNMKF